MRRIVLSLVVLAGVLGLSGCQQYLVFGTGSECSAPGVQLNGQLDLEGRVHGNDDVELGPDGSILGLVSASGTASVAPGVVLTPSRPFNATSSGPVRETEVVSIDAYRPGGAVAEAAAAQGRYYDFSGKDIDAASLAAAGLSEVPAGVYYTDGSATISGMEITVASEGPIELGSSSVSPWPGDPNQVAAITAHTDACDGEGVALAASCLWLEGRLVAPTSAITIEADWFVNGEIEIIGRSADIESPQITLGPLPPYPDDRFPAVGCPVGA